MFINNIFKTCIKHQNCSSWKSPHRHGKSIIHAIWDHTVLPGTRSGDFPAFIPAEAGTRFSDPGGMQS